MVAQGIKEDNFTPVFNELEKSETIPFDIMEDNGNRAGDHTPNEFEKRNRKYTELLANYLNSYKERHRVKMNLKKCFFWIVMVSYILVALGSLAIMFVALIKAPNAISLIIGSVATLITAIIGIPTIIANNLFPKDEDGNIVSMVKEMFQFDKDYSSNLESATKLLKEKEISSKVVKAEKQ